MTFVGNINLPDPDAWIKDIPDTVMVCSDRKGGWMLRHKYSMDWIKAIPTRSLADEILKAFGEIEAEAGSK